MMPSVTLLGEVTIEEGIVEQYRQVTRALNEARLNLDSCERFELELSEECNIKGPSYGQTHLSLSLVNITLHVCHPYNIIYYSQYREENGSITSHFSHWPSICLKHHLS